MAAANRKLSLLKPNRKTIYLENGKGQEVNYLFIPPELNRKALEKDVKAGAVQFKECLQFADKKPSRVVLIDCDNEEEGLMAVSYLAGIYNWKENVYERPECEYGYAEDDMEWNESEESCDYTMDDFKEWEEQATYNDIYGDGDDCDEPEGGSWEERPTRIPIVRMEQLTEYSNMSMDIFGQGSYSAGGQEKSHNRQPYWLTARRESICVMTSASHYSYRFGFGDMDESALISELRRFGKNRHVYVVLVSEKHKKQEPGTGMWNEDEDNASDDFQMNHVQTTISQMILEYTAGALKVSSDEESYKKYYQLLFENWAGHFNVKLEKRFPKKLVVSQIVSMQNAGKSELIEKVYRYVLSQERDSDILTKEDFAILAKFRALGMTVQEKEEKKSIQKLDTTLVGLEDVKRQVHSIVNVMKYNQRRRKMGLGNNGYHNVHLLIGAPGTAKTTVAQMLGNIMCEQKLLKGNRFISINGAELKGMYLGHSAPKTKRYFDEYDIILIDEAYSLTSDRELDIFSQEALAQLLIELEKHGMDRLVLFAGYGGKHVREQDNKMKQFLNANPGIRSRINSTIYFDSYTADEMLEIVHCQAKNMEFQLTHEADHLIHSYFAKRVTEPDFGNGREARSLLECITLQAASRTMGISGDKLTKKMLQELTREDVEAALKQTAEAYAMQKGQGRRKTGFVQGGYDHGNI